MPVARLPKPAEPQDLATLLSSPDAAEAGSQPTQPAPPYLPSYTNSYGQAPVQVNNGTVYNGTSSVVPQYMANPSSRTPQAELRRIDPEGLCAAGRQLLQQPLYPSAAPEVVSAQDYQRQQILAATQRAESQPLPITAVPQQEIYGPYVPYVPASQNAGYTPSPVPVQLGDNSPGPTVRHKPRSRTSCPPRATCRTLAPVPTPAQ